VQTFRRRRAGLSATAGLSCIASHTAALAQVWIKKKRPGFIGKNEWSTNSPDLNPLDCHVWGAMLGLNTEKAAEIHH